MLLYVHRNCMAIRDGGTMGWDPRLWGVLFMREEKYISPIRMQLEQLWQRLLAFKWQKMRLTDTFFCNKCHLVGHWPRIVRVNQLPSLFWPLLMSCLKCVDFYLKKRKIIQPPQVPESEWPTLSLIWYAAMLQSSPARRSLSVIQMKERIPFVSVFMPLINREKQLSHSILWACQYRIIV